MINTAYKFSEPGEIKTIILYIIKTFGGADISSVTDVFMEYEFVDYFSMRLAIDELRGAGLLDVYREGSSDKYILSDIGKEAMEGFEKNIPLSVRGSIHDTVKEYKLNIEKGQVITAKYIKHSDFDHEAELSINEGGTPLLKLSLCLGSADDAKKICKNFKKNPQRVYDLVLNGLL